MSQMLILQCEAALMFRNRFMFRAILFKVGETKSQQFIYVIIRY